KDAVALYDITRLNRPLVEAPANALLDLLYPPFYAAWGIALVAVALRRRLAWVALAVAIVLPLAPLTAELLKPLLAHHHDQLGPKYIANASWPSGHATAAATLMWCALLVAPQTHRRLVAALGAALAFAILRASGQDGDALTPTRARLGAGRRPPGAVRAWSP